MLPSITNLLNDDEDTSTYHNQQAPKVYIVAPSSPCNVDVIIDSNSTCPSPMSSSYCLSPSFPPSPIDSPLPPIFDVVGSDDDGHHQHALPPLQGCDPPLCRNKNSQFPEAVSWGIKYSHTTTTERPHIALQQPVFSPSTGQPVFKRRRGRPRSNSSQDFCFNNRDSPLGSGFGDNDAGGVLTFLAPTTWEVPPAIRSGSKSMIDFEDELRAPRKKRGRKPKVHLQGHSCFVLPSSLQQKLKKA